VAFRFPEKIMPRKLYLRQCAQVPVISTTDNFGAKPDARAAALRLCATGSAGISPTEPQRSQIRNATIAAARASGFAPKLSVVEITGTCAHCQNAA
jgi:hypothetical protein